MPSFAIAPLTDDRAAAAYPLARAAAPDLGLRAWRAYLKRLRAAGGGAICVVAEDAALLGIAAYRDEETLRGRMLRTDILVTFELSDAAPVRSVLVAELERLADQRGAGCLALALPARGYVGDKAGKTAGWLRLGLALDTVTLSKRLGGRARQEAGGGGP